MFSRLFALIPSTSLDAVVRLVAMWLGSCRLDMCSNSAPVMFWTQERTRSVESLT
jgi:hypothetical protein